MNAISSGPCPRRFSVGVRGTGPLRRRFIEILESTYQGVTVYDREREAARDDSRATRPRHPEVADIDAFFGRGTDAELLTLRSVKGHRHLNCAASPAVTTEHMDRFLRAAIAKLPELL